MLQSEFPTSIGVKILMHGQSQQLLARASCFSSNDAVRSTVSRFDLCLDGTLGRFTDPRGTCPHSSREWVDGGLRAGFILEGTFASETNSSKQAPRISRLGLSEADRSGSNISLSLSLSLPALYCNAPGCCLRRPVPRKADPTFLSSLVLRRLSDQSARTRASDYFAMTQDLDALVSLGIPRARAAFALKEHGGDAEAAADWCFSVRHAPRVHRRRSERGLLLALTVVPSGWLCAAATPLAAGRGRRLDSSILAEHDSDPCSVCTSITFPIA